MAHPDEQGDRPVPTSWSLGSSFNFVTSERSLGGRDLDFTDLMLMRIHGAVSPGAGFQAFVGCDLLPKQPSYTDEAFVQGVLLGAAFTFNDTLSMWARAEGGPQLRQQGYWLTSDAAVKYKHRFVKEFYFEAALGGTYNQLFFDEDRDQLFWFAEVLSQVGLAIRDDKGKGALWLFLDFHFPVVSNPTRGRPDAGAYLDPQTRVNFHLGGTVKVTDTLGLFLEWKILDRGDRSQPATQLPMVNTGFDQTHLVFGFVKHFEVEPAPKEPPQQQQSRQQQPSRQQQQQ